MKRLSRYSRGFILPTAILFTFLILSSVGLWYKQVIFQGFLSERLKDNRMLYLETEGLKPFLLERVQLLSDEERMVEDSSFIEVKVAEDLRWRVGRSALKDDKMEFIFDFSGKGGKVIRCIVGNIAPP